MKRILLFVISCAASGWVWAAQPLLTPAELQSRLNDPGLRVIDIRDPKSYAAKHIPGAVNAPYGLWRGPASNPGELPELKKLTDLVQSLGLNSGTHTVVVSSGADATDFGASARVYWTLKVLELVRPVRSAGAKTGEALPGVHGRLDAKRSRPADGPCAEPRKAAAGRCKTLG